MNVVPAGTKVILLRECSNMALSRFPAISAGRCCSAWLIAAFISALVPDGFFADKARHRYFPDARNDAFGNTDVCLRNRFGPDCGRTDVERSRPGGGFGVS